MSFNIIDMVKSQLTDQVMGSLGNVLGGDKHQTTSTLDAAIPGLLSSLTHAGSTEAGAKGLFDTINKQDDGILDNLGNMLSGNNQSSLIESGTGALSSVLGGNALGGLTNALSGFSGSSKGGITSMLGMFAPMIFGMIKRKLMGGSDGFNVGSLMNMLNGQKSNVAAAMPSGFANKLNFASVEDTLKKTTTHTREAVNNIASETKHVAQESVKEGGSILGKLLPLALLAGAAYFAYNMFGNKTEHITTPTEKHATAVEQTVHETTTAATDVLDIEGLSKGVTGAMGSLTEGFTGIKDVESAKAAVTNLTGATTDLGKYAGMLDKLPEGAKSKVIDLVKTGLPALREVINKVVTIPGVGPIIKPVVDGLLEKVAMFK